MNLTQTKSKFEPVAPQDRDPKLVMIGMPAIGNGVWDLCRTIVSLELQENNRGIRFIFYRCSDQGLGKARNILAYIARCSGASRLILLDRDLTPSAAAFFRLASHTEPLVGALYPIRDTPLRWVGEFMPATAEDQQRTDGLWPMWHLGTGALSISLDVIDKLIAAHPESAFEFEDPQPGGQIPYGAVMHDLFPMGPVTDSWCGPSGQPRKFSRYVTEDYYFCYNWRKLGGKLWVDSQCQIGHLGTIDFLELESKIEKRIDAALAQYKKDLESVGIKVPTLARSPEGECLGILEGDAK